MASSAFRPFGKFSNNNNSKPPPLPPKDPVYLQSRSASSRVSLLPTPTPDSPLSPSIQYAIRRANSPAMNSSSTDFLSPPHSQSDSYFYSNANGSSSNANISVNTTTTTTTNNNNGPRHMSAASKKNKPLAFLKFPKRSPRSPPPTSDQQPVIAIASNDDDPPPPQEDDGISLPWNFQHNIHVDEGYGGLPPSWSTSLASAGFTEEEIAAIQARRAAGHRSPPNMSYLYNERPDSPAGPAFSNFSFAPQPQASTSTQQQSQTGTSGLTPPPHIQPVPRTTSLPRLVVPSTSTSNGSSAASSSSTSQRPALPTIFTNNNANASTSAIPASSSSGLNLTLKPNPNFVGTPTTTTTPVQRVPPPKRKPPTPYNDVEDGGGSVKDLTIRSGRGVTAAVGKGTGHRQNELSTSTSGSSSNNHDTTNMNAQDPNDSFAGLNNSVAYRYNPPSPPPPMPAATTSAAYRHPYANPANVNPSYSSPNLSGTGAAGGSNSRSHSRNPSRAQSRTGMTAASDHEGGGGGGSSLGHGSSGFEDDMEDDDEDVDLPAALKTIRLGSESTVTSGASSSGAGGVMSMAGGTSRFRVVNGGGSGSALKAGSSSGGNRKFLGGTGRKEDEVSMLDMDLSDKEEEERKQTTTMWSAGKNKSSKVQANASASSSGHGHTFSQSASKSNLALSSSDHSHNNANAQSTSSHPGSSNNQNAFTTAAASASSSIAHASSVVARQSSNLVGAMRVGVGRIRSGKSNNSEKDGGGTGKEGKWGINIGSIGIGKNRKGKDSSGAGGKSKKKKGGKKGKDSTAGAGKTDGEDSDDASSGAYTSDEEFVSLPAEEGGVRTGGGDGAPVWQIYSRPRAGTDASLNNPSQYSLGVTSEGREGRHMPSASISSSNALPTSGVGRARSLRSATSQGSLRSRLGKAISSQNQSSTSIGGAGGVYGQASRSAGSLHSSDAHHRPTGSTTSLESIPEGEHTSPLSPERERPPMPEDAVGIVARNSMKKKDKRRTMGAPPRLSLLPDSSDLSSWSESLLSGISLSGDGGLGLSFGLDGEFEDKDKDKERGREKIESPGTAVVGTARPWERNPPTTKTPIAAPVPKAAPTPAFVPPVRATPTPPPPAVTAPIPPPTTSTPPNRNRKTGQPLPNSKPPPSRPIPPIAIANPNGISAITANNLRIERSKILAATGSNTNSTNSGNSSGRDSPALVEPTTNAVPSRSVPPTPLSPNANKPLPSLAAFSQAQVPAQSQPPQSKVISTSPPPGAGRPQGANTTADGLLSPRAADALSPAGSSAGPDSAQLWNEIEHMMDPGMISAIPGLHLSVALPPGAKNVMKSAGLPTTSTQVYHQQTPPPLPLPPGTQTVGDLVGMSPPPAEYSAALTETFSATLPFSPEEERVDNVRNMRAGEGVLNTKDAYSRPSENSKYPPEENTYEDDDDGSDYGDEGEAGAGEGYEGDNIKVLPPVPGSEPTTDLAVPLARNSKYLSVNSMEDLDMIDRDPNRDSSRSSSSTITVTALAATTTIVGNASIATRAGAYVIDSRRYRNNATGETKPPASPLSSHFGDSEESAGSGSGVSGRTRSSGGSTTTSSSQEQYLENPTPTTDDGGINSPLLYYLDGTQTPSPTPDKYAFPGNVRRLGPGGGQPQMKYLPQHPEDDEDYEDDPEFEGYPDEETMEAEAAAAATALAASNNNNTTSTGRPTIIISDDHLAIPDSHPTGSLTSVTSASPLSPLHPQYRGWLSFAVQPLSCFIDSYIADPRLHYLDLREIAEGESGSVYAARVNMEQGAYKMIKERLSPSVRERDEREHREAQDREVWVAIKSVAIVPLPSASAGLAAAAPSAAATISATKLRDLQHELTLLRDLSSTHDNILGMDAVYVDLLEDSLWVRMELMERSLADIVALVGDGLQLQERVVARFTSDVLSALDYLQKHNIAHRDVRSDNLLLNKHGVLKLAEFSNAVQVTHDSPMRDDVVGVIYWQAPEVRKPPYNALKVDVWSLGATVWEMAQQDPPFSDTQGPTTVGPSGLSGERWPPLRQPELFSPAFHDFLKRCSEPAALRPDPAELLKSSFITHKACGRHVVVLLLSQCMSIEKALQDGGS